MTMIRYPLPITAAMLAPANVNIAKPRYDTPADWSQGATGNEEDIATGSSPVVSAADGSSITPYPYRTQTARAAAMVPPRSIVDDLGIDYGTYKGQAGRTGAITPRMPYPDATSPPSIASVTPATGGVAGGTFITITGMGFAQAISVAIGGTAATSITIVDANTLTVTTPAKTAGSYDVVVTTPRGTNPTGTKFTYA